MKPLRNVKRVHPPNSRLSDADRHRAASIVAKGCDPSTVGPYLGLSPANWQRILAADPLLASELAKAEAEAEVHYMECVHAAAEEAKNYRSSVWWLERRRPDAYARRAAKPPAPEELKRVIDAFCGTVSEVVQDDGVLETIIARMGELVDDVGNSRSAVPG